MAGPWLMAVMLVFFPSVGSLTAVNQNNLAKLIKDFKNEYKLEGTKFSLALSIQNEDPNNPYNLEEQLFPDDPVDEVAKQLSKGAVYKGKRLVVAKVAETEDSMLRVLQRLHLDSSEGDLLVFYSRTSPSPETSANIKSPDNIIKEINCVIDHGVWSNYVFVFEDVFEAKGGIFTSKKGKLKDALNDLGESRIPLANIFRCYKPQNIHGDFQCTSCSNGGKVEDKCIKQ